MRGFAWEERQHIREAEETCHGQQRAEPRPYSHRHTLWVTYVVLFWISLSISLGGGPGAQAQEPFGTDQPQRPGPVAPPLPQEQPLPTLPRPGVIAPFLIA